MSLPAFGGSRLSLARVDTTPISALLFTWLPLLSVSSACLFQGHLSLDLGTPRTIQDDLLISILNSIASAKTLFSKYKVILTGSGD